MGRAIKDAREIGQAATLTPTLAYAGIHFLLCSRLDAEEWRDLVGAYLDAASTAVVEMAGRSRRSSAMG
jgi:hypothetical protein